MTNYYVTRLGPAGSLVDYGREHNCILVRWEQVGLDLTPYKHLDKSSFVEQLRPVIEKNYPDKTKNQLSAIIYQLYRFVCQMQIGDIVLVSKADEGKWYLARIESDYLYEPDGMEQYCHQRKVQWIAEVATSSLSQELRNSAGSIMTIFNISSHAPEIETLLQGPTAVESLESFGLEAHLEEFMVHNWTKLPLAKEYDIYTDENGESGQQYITEAGRIDILTRRKDDKGWLVVELKKGRSGDEVVGQVLRYMGFVRKHIAKSGDTVKGVVITGEKHQNISYAVSELPDVEFMTYQVQFTLKQES